jgi:hypothetical protein
VPPPFQPPTIERPLMRHILVSARPDLPSLVFFIVLIGVTFLV